MKIVVSLFFSFLLTLAQAQNKEELLNDITNEVCFCIEKVGEGKLINNPLQVVMNCVQTSFTHHVDEVIEIYGNNAIESNRVGEEIGLEVSLKLAKDCEFYKKNITVNTEVAGEDFTEIQLATIDRLSNWVCDCSKEEVEKDPNANLQKTLETCLEKSVSENVEQVTEVFGNEVLNDQMALHNISVEVGNKLILTCDFFTSKTLVAAQAINGLFVTGKVSDYKSRGDFIEVTLVDLDGTQSKYVVNYGFTQASSFVSSLKELKNNDTVITIYYYKGELYFKKEDVKKVVNIIEDVKF